MKTAIATLAALLVSAEAALAQDHALTPTDLLDFGQLSATARFQIAEGKTNLVDRTGTLDIDADTDTHRLLLDAAIGLGMGFELELSAPYQVKGVTDGDGELGVLSVDFEEEDDGFGDLQITANYRLLKESGTDPQWLFGLIIVAPTGNDKQGEGDLQTTPPSIFDTVGEEGGIGQGVWRYGFGTAIGKKMGMIEPYLALSYVFGGERERNDVDEERADVGTVLLGSEFHVTPQATIDLRAYVLFVGEDITEENRREQKAEEHNAYGGSGALYISLGPVATLVVGAGVTVVEDFESDATAGLQLEDTFEYTLQLGLHLKLGL